MNIEELKPEYESVFTVTDYWDGPRKGVRILAREDDLAQSLDVARVQVQLHVQDGAVEVEGHQPVAKGDCYLLTSGFNRFAGRPPRIAVAMLRAAIADISDRVRTVALAMCGASTTFGMGISPG